MPLARVILGHRQTAVNGQALSRDGIRRVGGEEDTGLASSFKEVCVMYASEGNLEGVRESWHLGKSYTDTYLGEIVDRGRLAERRAGRHKAKNLRGQTQ